MKKVRLSFAPGLQVEFTSRDRAIQQVLEWSEKGTRFPIVAFGPEGCGKTAWLKQAAEILHEKEYDVVYVNPLQKEYLAYVGVKEVAERLAEIAVKALWSVGAELAYAALNAAKELVKMRRKNVAVLVDDAFQALGSEKAAAAYVKVFSA
jgi:predicted AAA+ superfamily ATPase